MSCTSCILPYIHLYAEPNGEVKPCCIAGGFKEKLSLRDSSVEEVFNSPQMKELRKTMEEGERHPACNVCYEREDRGEHSPRKSFNENALWKMPHVNKDYSVTTDLQHVDIRFSNLCNFKCRMCNHTFSSEWYREQPLVEQHSQDKDFDKDKWYKENTKVVKVCSNMVDKLKPHIKNVKSWYFAGGEPLIMPEHAETLNHLHETIDNTRKYWDVELDDWAYKKDLSIHYNTNLSILRFEKYNFLDIWFDFIKVFLSISCDGVGEVGEYQRTGFKHDTFIKNLKEIRKYFKPGASHDANIGYNYNFQYTTTVYNVYHMWDFYQFMMDGGYITDETQIDWYFAWAPFRASLKHLPQYDKKKVLKYLDNLVGKFKHPAVINRLESIINYTAERPESQFFEYHQKEVMIGQNGMLDKLRGTNLTDINGMDFNKSIKPKIGSIEWKAMNKM